MTCTLSFSFLNIIEMINIQRHHHYISECITYSIMDTFIVMFRQDKLWSLYIKYIEPKVSI